MIVHRIDIIARDRHLKFTGRFIFLDLVVARRSVATLAAVRFGVPVVVFFDNELDDLLAAIVGPDARQAMSEAGIRDGFNEDSVV